MFHMRESYVLEPQIYNPDTPTYIETLSGEHGDKYYKAMDYLIQSLMGRDILGIVSRMSVTDHNLIPETWSFN